MALFRVSLNAWGQEVLLGISWDLAWVFLGAAFLFIALHILYKLLIDPARQRPARERMTTGEASGGAASRPAADRVIRHRLPDRLFHWANAIAVFVLLGTSLLPVAGFKFPWVTAHWIAGVLLTLLVLFHIARALIWLDRSAMGIGRGDGRRAVQSVRWMFRRRRAAPDRPGKYPLPQKLFHHFLAAVLLTAIGTGIFMLAKIDAPFWTRDPYLLSAGTWGIVYVLHGLTALILLALIVVHIYFALRPEKLYFTRSMILGWIGRDDYDANHDPALWPVGGNSGPPAPLDNRNIQETDP